MGTVRNILDKKGRTVYTVSPDSTVFDALHLLEEQNLGSLIVTDQGELIGVFTERDYARKVAFKGRGSKETLIREIMSDRPIVVNLHSSIEECMQLMTEKHIRHLPVMEGSELVGIISIGDLVKYIIEEKDHVIDNLRHYITT